MILITGATGLLGAHLTLELLRKGQQVRAIYRNQVNIKKTQSVFKYYNQLELFEQIQWIQADITDICTLEDAYQNITQVYHCAALVSFDPKDQEKMRKVNIQGTANMVNLAIDSKIEKFCHVSSIATLGQQTDVNMAITEQTPWNPDAVRSYYSISKYGAEMEVWRASQEGLNVVIVNPGIIFGPGYNYGTLKEMIDRVNKGFPFYTQGSTGIIGIDQVVTSMLFLMESQIQNQRYILVSDNITYKNLIDSISLGLRGKKTAKIKANKLLCTTAYIMDYLYCILTNSKRSFTKDMSLSTQGKSIYNSKKIELLINKKLQGYDTYLPQTLAFYKKHN